MVRNTEIQQFSHHRLNLLNARITKFKYPFAINADKMIMLFEGIGFFELSNILSELVLCYQIAGQQMFYRIVYCCPANPVLFVFHVDVQRLHIKVIVDGINFIKYGKPLRCFSESLFFKEN